MFTTIGALASGTKLARPLGNLERYVQPVRPSVLKAFAIFASAIMVLVVFSQNVGPASSTSKGGGDEFEEQARRLTVAEGASRLPRLAPGVSGAVHLAWIDGRSGSLGVYEKATRNDGFTFSGDRPLAARFQSITDLSLATLPQDRIVAVAWSGSLGSAPSQVYVRASSDDGATWGQTASVGPGDSAAIVAVPGILILGYVYRSGLGVDQVRLVSLPLAGSQIRGGRGLLAFNSSASDVALVAAGGLVRLVWVDHISGFNVFAHVSVNPVTGAVSPVHVIATFRASLAGRLSLIGRGSTLLLFWSDDYSGTFDVKSAISLDAGTTWPGGGPLAAGLWSETQPSATWGPDFIGVVWQEG